MPSAVSVLISATAHELLKGICVANLRSKVPSETTRMCGKMFNLHWAILAIS